MDLFLASKPDQVSPDRAEHVIRTLSRDIGQEIHDRGGLAAMQAIFYIMTNFIVGNDRDRAPPRRRQERVLGTGNTSVGRVEPESVAIAASLSALLYLYMSGRCVSKPGGERYPVLDGWWGGGPRVVEGGCGFFFFKASLTRAPVAAGRGAASRERDTHAHTGVL